MSKSSSSSNANTTTVLVLSTDSGTNGAASRKSPPLLLSLFNAPYTFTAGLLPWQTTTTTTTEMTSNIAISHPIIDNTNKTQGQYRCTACGNITFADSQSQRAHFKLPFHVENIRRRLHQLGRPLSADEYELWKLGLWVESDGNTSFETCSEQKSEDASDTDDDDDADDDDTEEEEEGEATNADTHDSNLSSDSDEVTSKDTAVQSSRGTPMFWMRHGDYPQHRIGIYKQLALPQRLSRRHQPTQEEEAHATEQVLAWLWKPRPSSSSVHKVYWSMFLFVAGRFSGIVVDISTGKMMAHKTFRKYTVRKKRGFAQASHDKKTGHKVSSAGATLRRENHHNLELSVGQLLVDWRSYLDASERVFIRCSVYHSSTLFSSDSPLKRNDDRIRKIPFETKRPSYKEACDAMDRISRFYVEPL